MRKLFARLIENFGYLTAIRIYFRFLRNGGGELKVPDIKFPVVYRKDTIDSYTLKEVFFFTEYNIKFPFSSAEQLFIIDAGANIGFTSVYFANKYPNSTILAVEPEEGNFVYLQRNIEKYPNISARRCAVWPKKAHVELRDNGYGYRGYMVEEMKTPSRHAVEAVSIADLLGDRSVIDLLKIDIEGSEKELFTSNYQSWLPRVKCLVIELHDRLVDGCSRQVFRTLSQYNFSCFTKGENLCFINQDHFPEALNGALTEVQAPEVMKA